MRTNLRRFVATLAGLTLLTGVFAVTSYATAEPSDAATELRVMSWNIHGGDPKADIDKIAAEISSYDPDIVTLQEVMQVRGDNQVRRLADALGMVPHFGAADNPGPCDDPRPGKAGNAILTKHSIVKHVTKPLPTDPGLCVVDRSMAGANITLNSGETVVVFTTHLTPGLSERITKLRQSQARYALDYLDHGQPLLFTGDMNARPTGTVPGWITDAGFTDTGAVVDSGDTHRSQRIDYVYSKKLKPTWGVSPGTDASDHRAVIIDLTLG